MNWDSMTPRERDAAVAQALGWTAMRVEIGYLVGIPQGRKQTVSVPHYTTDLGAMDAIVNELKKHVAEIVIHIERKSTWLALDKTAVVTESDSIPALLSYGLLMVKGEVE